MPLDYTGVAAGSQARSAQLKQVLDLLTGVMHDQPVTFKSDTYGVFDLDTVTAATKQGLRLRDGGAIKWELFKETDLSFNLWDTVGGIAALKFASNGGGVGTLGGLAFAAGLGLAGATTGGMRFVGTTPAGPPLTGTFAVGDFIYDMTMFGRWVCITAGAPGTWVALEGAITSPKAPTIVVNTTGTTSWWYKIVAEGFNGSTFYAAIPSAAVKITNGAATPNNTVNWTAPIGVDPARISYVVLRSTDGVTYSRIAFPGAGVLTFTDNNAAANAYTAATVNPGGGRVIGAQPYRARVRLTTNQAIAFNPGYVKILYQTVDYDPNSNWDATNHVYVIPVSGFYQVAHEQSYNFGSQTGFFESGIILNGAAAPLANSGSSAQIDNTNSWMQGCAAAPTIYFNAGDTLAIVTAPQMTVGAATLVGDGSARSTHATFEYRGS